MRFTRAAVHFAVAAIGLFVISASAKAQYTVTLFTTWGQSDASMGIAGSSIVDFESLNIDPNVKVKVTTSGAAGSYGPTSVLPNLFNPTLDPFGSAFIPSPWDGQDSLVNTGDNQSHFYPTAANWGTVEFSFVNAASYVGFSIEQMELNAGIAINGTSIGTLTGTFGVPTSTGRNGYIVIRATGASAPISSVKINSVDGDGIAYDHLTYKVASQGVPEPGMLTILMGFGVGGTLLLRRRNRCN